MIILLDNGSKRPEATKNLRRLAATLSRRVGENAYPVSLLHSSAIPASELDARPADTLEPFLTRQVNSGHRVFSIVPLFFGPSRAIDVLVPEIRKRVEARDGPLDIRIAPILCPLPEGEAHLLDILEGNARDAIARLDRSPSLLVLVDHGSPVPRVTAVRRWLASGLAGRFAGQCRVTEAVMERREGAQYDFNGELLEDVLAAAAKGTEGSDIVLAMQFISPGRHAGPSGDIERIAKTAMDKHRGLRIATSRLVSEHPLFDDILVERTQAVVGPAQPSPC